MARDLDGAIAERSRTMLGLITTTELDALGVSRQQRRTLVGRHVLVPVGGGVYRHAAYPTSWLQSALATALAAGDGGLASHETGGALWRFDRVEPPRDPEVLVPFGRHPRAVPGRVHRSRDLPLADYDRVGLIPVTSPSRTLCDLAPRLPADRLEAVLDHAEQRGLIWRPHLRWRLDALRRSGRPGLPKLADLLDRTDGRPLGDSWLEQEAIRLVTHAGLPVPRVQVRLRRRPRTDGRAGARAPNITRVDLLWDDALLVAEIAGHGTHARRRDRQADAERASDLTLQGWRIVTFVYEDVVERPEYVIDTLRAHLGLADPTPV